VARDLHISVSIGVAVSKPGTEYSGDYEQLVRRADAALYAAKARGGDRVELGDSDRVGGRAPLTELGGQLLGD
jgi:PleD family two-component response regulator